MNFSKEGQFWRISTVLFCLLLSIGASQGASKKETVGERIEGEMIIKMKHSLSPLDISAFAKSLKAEDVRPISVSFGNFYVVKFPKNMNLTEEKALLDSNSSIEYSEPNFVYRIVAPIIEGSVTKSNNEINQDAPNDPLFSTLWALNNTGTNDPKGSAGKAGADIRALSAWDINKGDKKVKIAIIDTGINYNHPDLKNQIYVNEAELNGRPGVDDDKNGFIDDIHGYDFANNDGDPMDGHGHGSHCAGTIGAVHGNGVGVAGIMENVTLIPIKFLSDEGSGSTETAIKAIDYATNMNVDIMSNSWGGGGESQALKEAIERANEKGIIFTAAAGNDGTNNDSSPHYPSNYNVENVISVAATTANDELASFSCYGPKTVHIAAPGHNIQSTITNNGYAIWSGTSMATPHVTGALGLLISQEGRLSVSEIKERLMATSDPVKSLSRKIVTTSGRLNAYNLLTDTRPVRTGPKPGSWETVSIEALESAHPYGNDANVSKTITIPGAKFIRLVIEKYETEAKYDVIDVKDLNGESVDSIDGAGENYISNYAEGESLVFSFKSDGSVTRWGYLIKEVQVVR